MSVSQSSNQGPHLWRGTGNSGSPLPDARWELFRRRPWLKRLVRKLPPGRWAVRIAIVAVNDTFTFVELEAHPHAFFVCPSYLVSQRCRCRGREVRSVRWVSPLRLLDCASVYGNEAQIGEDLDEIVRSGKPRNRIWITSKLWNDMHVPGDATRGRRKALNDLHLDYLDLFLAHGPFSNHHPPSCDVSSRSIHSQGLGLSEAHRHGQRLTGAVPWSTAPAAGPRRHSPIQSRVPGGTPRPHRRCARCPSAMSPARCALARCQASAAVPF